ncbi:MAG: putative bifunctional diguanylate cyclase/phosphodiesterase, partial [Dehalococcoidia bacterium]
RVLGVLNLFDRYDGLPFSDDDQRLAEGIAHHAASALERVRLTAAIRESEARYRSVVDNTSDIIVILDAKGTIRYVSPSVERVLGHRPESLIGRNVLSIINPEDVPRAQETFAKRIAEPHTQQPPAVYRIRRSDGTWCYLETQATNLLADPSVGGIVASARDITLRKALEEQLKYRAFYDPLTELPNRALFMDRLGHALAGTSRRTGAVAVIFLDLDGFKVVNDSLGHGIGDALLAAVGHRLINCMRPTDTVARFGGDEFTVLMEDVEGVADARGAADRIIEDLRLPFTIHDRELFITASVGIALDKERDGSCQPENLLREADIALYRAKGAGKSHVVVYSQEMNTSVVDRLDLTTDLRRALERNELQLYYQPEIDLKTNAVVGVEALLRWQHPLRGLIGPADFVPLAEETGLILPIGQWVFEEACRQSCTWRAQRPGGPQIELSVNLSRRQFQQHDLVQQVAAVLRQTGLRPECLKLEITESVIMQDAEQTINTLFSLKGLGVKLAIDDFGTGYSSLSYLQRFPVETLKVDRSVVSKVDHDPGTVSIVEAVVALAHVLGLQVTAEGIDTAEQLAGVRRLRCNRGQCYYFARPIPSDRLFELLDTGIAILRPAP